MQRCNITPTESLAVPAARRAEGMPSEMNLMRTNGSPPPEGIRRYHNLYRADDGIDLNTRGSENSKYDTRKQSNNNIRKLPESLRHVGGEFQTARPSIWDTDPLTVPTSHSNLHDLEAMRTTTPEGSEILQTLSSKHNNITDSHHSRITQSNPTPIKGWRGRYYNRNTSHSSSPDRNTKNSFHELPEQNQHSGLGSFTGSRHSDINQHLQRQNDMQYGNQYHRSEELNNSQTREGFVCEQSHLNSEQNTKYNSQQYDDFHQQDDVKLNSQPPGNTSNLMQHYHQHPSSERDVQFDSPSNQLNVLDLGKGSRHSRDGKQPCDVSNKLQYLNTNQQENVQSGTSSQRESSSNNNIKDQSGTAAGSGSHTSSEVHITRRARGILNEINELSNTSNYSTDIKRNTNPENEETNSIKINNQFNTNDGSHRDGSSLQTQDHLKLQESDSNNQFNSKSDGSHAVNCSQVTERLLSHYHSDVPLEEGSKQLDFESNLVTGGHQISKNIASGDGGVQSSKILQESNSPENETHRVSNTSGNHSILQSEQPHVSQGNVLNTNASTNVYSEGGAHSHSHLVQSSQAGGLLESRLYDNSRTVFQDQAGGSQRTDDVNRAGADFYYPTGSGQGAPCHSKVLPTSNSPENETHRVSNTSGNHSILQSEQPHVSQGNVLNTGASTNVYSEGGAHSHSHLVQSSQAGGLLESRLYDNSRTVFQDQAGGSQRTDDVNRAGADFYYPTGSGQGAPCHSKVLPTSNSPENETHRVSNTSGNHSILQSEQPHVSQGNVLNTGASTNVYSEGGAHSHSHLVQSSQAGGLLESRLYDNSRTVFQDQASGSQRTDNRAGADYTNYDNISSIQRRNTIDDHIFQNTQSDSSNKLCSSKCAVSRFNDSKLLFRTARAASYSTQPDMVVEIESTNYNSSRPSCWGNQLRSNAKYSKQYLTTSDCINDTRDILKEALKKNSVKEKEQLLNELRYNTGRQYNQFGVNRSKEVTIIDPSLTHSVDSTARRSLESFRLGELSDSQFRNRFSHDNEYESSQAANYSTPRDSRPLMHNNSSSREGRVKTRDGIHNSHIPSESVVAGFANTETKSSQRENTFPGSDELQRNKQNERSTSPKSNLVLEIKRIARSIEPAGDADSCALVAGFNQSTRVSDQSGAPQRSEPKNVSVIRVTRNIVQSDNSNALVAGFGQQSKAKPAVVQRAPDQSKIQREVLSAQQQGTERGRLQTRRGRGIDQEFDDDVTNGKDKTYCMSGPTLKKIVIGSGVGVLCGAVMGWVVAHMFVSGSVVMTSGVPIAGGGSVPISVAAANAVNTATASAAYAAQAAAKKTALSIPVGSIALPVTKSSLSAASKAAVVAAKSSFTHAGHTQLASSYSFPTVTATSISQPPPPEVIAIYTAAGAATGAAVGIGTALYIKQRDDVRVVTV